MRADKFIALTNDVFDPTKHYITIFVLCRRVVKSQEPAVRRCSSRILNTICEGSVLIQRRSSSRKSASAGSGRAGMTSGPLSQGRTGKTKFSCLSRTSSGIIPTSKL